MLNTRLTLNRGSLVRLCRNTAFVFLAFLIASCATIPTSLMDQLGGLKDGDKITVGTVQKEITVGMSSTDVIVALGSPNIITTDDQRRENWVYDKIATESFASGSQGRPSLLWFVPSQSNVGSSTSQRTLTIIIKFDKENKVRDFAYHTSRF
jgi:outer membrane protein assembly factor BamE (lipoprotein component of BamABCDE complex)